MRDLFAVGDLVTVCYWLLPGGDVLIASNWCCQVI